MHHMALRLKSDIAAEALGLSLQLAREQRKITRAVLARKLNIDQSQISRIERGQMFLVGRNVHKICTFLNVQPDPYIGLSPSDQISLQSRLLRLNARLGGQQEGDAAVSRLLDALEAFAEAYST